MAQTTNPVRTTRSTCRPGQGGRHLRAVRFGARRGPALLPELRLPSRREPGRLRDAAQRGHRPPRTAPWPPPRPANQQWTPAFAILAIGLLGVMLLLGVLIGKKGNDNTQTVAAQAAPTTTTAARAYRHHSDHRQHQEGREGRRLRNGARRGQRGPAARVHQWRRDSRHQRVLQQNAKNGPDVVATGGEKAALDPNGAGRRRQRRDLHRVLTGAITAAIQEAWVPRDAAPIGPAAASDRPPDRGSAQGQGRPAQGRLSKAGPNGASVVGTPVGQPELLKQREELSRKFAELQWDLGGIAYEMASRDHYRLDVLNKQSAKLQEVDAELGQIERLLKLGTAGAAGTCPSCGALQARGAAFCWQCGNELRPAAKPSDPKPQAKPPARRRARWRERA